MEINSWCEDEIRKLSAKLIKSRDFPFELPLAIGSDYRVDIDESFCMIRMSRSDFGIVGI